MNPYQLPFINSTQKQIKKNLSRDLRARKEKMLSFLLKSHSLWSTLYVFPFRKISNSLLISSRTFKLEYRKGGGGEKEGKKWKLLFKFEDVNTGILSPERWLGGTIFPTFTGGSKGGVRYFPKAISQNRLPK